MTKYKDLKIKAELNGYVQVPREWFKRVGKLISKCHDQDNIPTLLANLVELFRYIEEAEKYLTKQL